jgi:hypothetical protein
MSKETQNNIDKVEKPVYKKWWFWLLIVLGLIIIGSLASGGENGNTNNDTSNSTEPPKVIEPEPAFEPLTLTGKGINVTKSFEISKGKYDIGYKFSNNLSEFGTGRGTNFISDIVCDNSSTGIFSLTNLIEKAGDGTKIIEITSATDTCYFEVEDASSKASWTFTVTKR